MTDYKIIGRNYCGFMMTLILDFDIDYIDHIIFLFLDIMNVNSLVSEPMMKLRF